MLLMAIYHVTTYLEGLFLIILVLYISGDDHSTVAPPYNATHYNTNWI